MTAAKWMLLSLPLTACTSLFVADEADGRLSLNCDDRYTHCASADLPARPVRNTALLQVTTPELTATVSSSVVAEMPPSASLVYFGFNRAEASQVRITEHIDYLQRHPDAVATLSGYTDPIGSDEYNLSLSQRRAEFVFQQFVAAGIPAKQLLIQSMGEQNLMVATHAKHKQLTWEALIALFAPNRRVEIHYQP
jgi:outer membrane protein OmpA-like peptidoglycan-associated protein